MNSNYQTPEGKAREHIDKMLNDEGWNVVSRSAIEVDKPMAVKEAILGGKAGRTQCEGQCGC